MFSRKFPELSATCGINSDGIPLGAINDSQFLGVELLVPFATNTDSGDKVDLTMFEIN